MRPLTVRHTDIKSSSGKSVVSAYDYAMRQGKYRKHRRDVLIFGHGHLPEWSRDNPRFFWECVEGFSTRKNAVLKGMNLKEGATAKERNRQIGGHSA